MRLTAWFKKRGIRFVIQRAKKLNERYGLRPEKAVSRIRSCVTELREYNCLPTFFVPAVVVRRNLSFILDLQSQGCEIGVHGYQHVDLKSYPPAEANRQLMQAAELFLTSGLEVHGFRCPYLSVSDELMHVLSPDVFKYSSNRAVEWSYRTPSGKVAPLLFDTLQQFYQPSGAMSTLSLPWEQDGLIEVPVSVPDDLQLFDGLEYKMEEIASAWSELLAQTHQRGELFNLMFHPELASLCAAPFISVLREVQSLKGKVWVTRLKEISAWWQEKGRFTISIEREKTGYTLRFACSPRGTVLYRGFDLEGDSNPWDAKYRRYLASAAAIDGPILPVIGLAAGAAEWVSSALDRMGYIVLIGDDARQCSLYLGHEVLERFNNPVSLIEYIEGMPVPLVRFWPWPDGARSALCLTGDLDALSLMDYAVRLLPV